MTRGFGIGSRHSGIETGNPIGFSGFGTPIFAEDELAELFIPLGIRGYLKSFEDFFGGAVLVPFIEVLLSPTL